jgi:hypothetical protein
VADAFSDSPMNAPHDPARPHTDPSPLILRRSGSVTASFAVAQVVLVAVMSVVLWPTPYYLIPVAAVWLGAVAWTVTAWFRCRTEIRPEGITDRTIRGTEVIPWRDVAKVVPVAASGTIAVARRGGGVTRLAGTRGRRPRRGPGMDEVIAAIRAHIDLERPAGTEPDSPVPAVVVRRLSWTPIRPLLFGLVFLGVICAALVGVHVMLGLAAVFLLGLAALMCVLTLRSRTEIGPDGIRNRALRADVFTPWADVRGVTVSESSPRTVQVDRHSGPTVTLAAVRDIDVPADGLGLDDIAELIRQRAGLDGEPGAAASEVQAPAAGAEPLSVRPSRRPLLWIVPLGVALTAGWILTLDHGPLIFLAGFLLVFPLYLFVLAVHLLAGRTDAGPDGLRNRHILRATTMPWQDVKRFVIVPTLFGRIVQVVRPNGKRITLAAPREGLLGRDPRLEFSVETMRALAATRVPDPPARQALPPRTVRTVWAVLLVVLLTVGVVAWQPWLEPWWPTRHEATKLPRACALLGPATIQAFVPNAQRDGDDRQESYGSIRTNCALRNESGSALDFDVELDHRTGTDSGSHNARELFSIKRAVESDVRPQNSTAQPVSGLGDEAWQRLAAQDGRTSVDLLVRQSNVVIDLHCRTERRSAQASSDAQAVARRVLEQLLR